LELVALNQVENQEQEDAQQADPSLGQPKQATYEALDNLNKKALRVKSLQSLPLALFRKK